MVRYTTWRDSWSVRATYPTWLYVSWRLYITRSRALILVIAVIFVLESKSSSKALVTFGFSSPPLSSLGSNSSLKSVINWFMYYYCFSCLFWPSFSSSSSSVLFHHSHLCLFINMRIHQASSCVTPKGCLSCFDLFRYYEQTYSLL